MEGKKKNMARKPDPLSVEYLLLGIIMKQSIHAYDLDKMLNSTEDLNIVWRFNQSQLYAVLDKLERNGLIMSTISTGSAFPFRKVYSLTEHGLSEFRKWKTSPVEQPNAMRSNFLVKLYFLENEPLSVFESIVRDQIAVSQKWLDAQTNRRNDEANPSTYKRMVLEFRIGNIQSTIDWLEDCIEIKRQQESSEH